MSAGFETVADEAEVGEGAVHGVHVVGHPVVVCKVRGRLYACSADCTHEEGGDLALGTLDGFTLKCPAHGCAFDVRSGRIVSGPAEEPLPTYEVRAEGGHVLVAHRPRGF